MSETEAQRLLRFMKFPNMQDLSGYSRLLVENECDVTACEDTELFAPHVDLYLSMLRMQLTSDALRIVGFDTDMFQAIIDEMTFMQQLAHERKIVQGRVVARKKTLRARRIGQPVAQERSSGESIVMNGACSGGGRLPSPRTACGNTGSRSCSSDSSCASETQSPLRWFDRMIANCLEYAKAAKQEGRPIVGILCEFTPRELIMAAGGVPVCLCGGSRRRFRPPRHSCPPISAR